MMKQSGSIETVRIEDLDDAGLLNTHDSVTPLQSG